MEDENKIKILDLIPEELRSQLEKEVLASIEARKKAEKKPATEAEINALVDAIMPGTKSVAK